MKVYALVGKSGTGKSYQAINLCRHMNIEYIIDDGLLIGGSSILAGTSAKRRETMMGAIKTALFTENEHRDDVASKIAEIEPDSILVIGTSHAMVHKITERLGLPPIERIIEIEDITTEEERETAAKQRYEHGKHVIPVPAPQLKRDFSGYFMDPLRLLRSFNSGSKGTPGRTVMRPTYSYLGDYTISDRVINDIVIYAGEREESVYKVTKVLIDKTDEGVRLTIHVIMNYGADIISEAENVQKKIADVVEKMTAFNADTVNIEVRGLKCS
ncbi:MAG: Asp23/Gls24 family envelope stress response protein [Firmicutes bacterium]|nr:Asp23/Gls24 family envelope stress response protein [Bacillota bacterium]